MLVIPKVIFTFIPEIINDFPERSDFCLVPVTLDLWLGRKILFENQNRIVVVVGRVGSVNFILFEYLGLAGLVIKF